MEKIIEVENLSKEYENFRGIRDISFCVKKGEFLGILGVNGSGKSTTIECVLGTKKIDSGTVKLFGMNPTKNRKRVFERVSVQFQEGSYQDKITVEEICKLRASYYKNSKDYNSLLEDVDLSNKKDSIISKLSGGEKQRLFIALSLISNPEIIFLDELTTNLDTQGRRKIWSILDNLKKTGLTVVMVSHFMDEVEVLCDRLLIIENGVTVFYGNKEDALIKSGKNNLEDAYIWYTERMGF